MFAKLFCVKDTQVLLYKEYDAEEDCSILKTITTIDGLMFKCDLGFEGDNQEEKMEKAYNKFDQDSAERFYNMVINTLNNGEDNE